MSDGPWLRLGLGDPTIGSALALALAQEYLGGLQAPSQDTPP